MKKVLALCMSLAMTLALVACSPAKPGEVKAGKFQGEAKGYEGAKLVMEIETNAQGALENVTVLEHGETGLGEGAVQALPAKILEAQSVDVDVIAGATETSKAILDAVKMAMTKANIDPAKMSKKSESKEGAEMTELQTDVVILGAGGAGLTAGIEAATAGKKVIIVEKNAMAGGNSIRATGGMNAAKTALQDQNKFDEGKAVESRLASAKEKYPDLAELIATVEKQYEAYKAKPEGYFDSKELFILDTLVGGKNLNDRQLVDTLVANSPAAIDWLKSIGIDLKSVGQFGGASVKRIHRPVNAEGKTAAIGAFMMPILEKVAKDKGVEILYENPAKKLLVDNGAVVGVETAKNKILAKSVVIATGGFAGNLEKVAQLKPELKGFVTTNAPGIMGDGIQMAEEVGAAVVDMDQIQIHPTVEQKTSALITEGLRGDGAILVNAAGKRFTDEVGTRDAVSKAEIEQEGGFVYLIVDGKMAEKSNVIQGYIKKGFTVSGESYEELAKALEMDPKVFAATMEDWNKAVAAGQDEAFGRKNFAEALDKAPYYAIKVAPGVHHTMGGLKINSLSQVLNQEGQPIANLYAAGEVTGGVHGANRLGGNAVADFVIFGRVAGQEAAKNMK